MLHEWACLVGAFLGCAFFTTPILTSEPFSMIFTFIILKPHLKLDLLWEVLPDYSSPQVFCLPLSVYWLLCLCGT